MTDRTLAIVGALAGLLGLLVAVGALWLSFASAPWFTKNEYYCYQINFRDSCFFTRADCERAGRKQDFGVLDKHCRPEADPVHE